METKQTTPTEVSPDQFAFISGVSDSLFHFDTVAHYAQSMKWTTPEAEITRAKKNGHELAWANPEAAVLTTSKAFHEMEDARRASALRLTLGQLIRLEGVVYRIEKAPNRNVKLVAQDPQ